MMSESKNRHDKDAMMSRMQMSGIDRKKMDEQSNESYCRNDAMAGDLKMLMMMMMRDNPARKGDERNKTATYSRSQNLICFLRSDNDRRFESRIRSTVADVFARVAAGAVADSRDYPRLAVFCNMGLGILHRDLIEMRSGSKVDCRRFRFLYSHFRFRFCFLSVPADSSRVDEGIPKAASSICNCRVEKNDDQQDFADQQNDSLD